MVKSTGDSLRCTGSSPEALLCNMALVSTEAAWDGFKGNIVRVVRAGGHSFRERQLCERLKQTSSYKHIGEPLA